MNIFINHYLTAQTALRYVVFTEQSAVFSNSVATYIVSDPLSVKFLLYVHPSMEGA